MIPAPKITYILFKKALPHMGQAFLCCKQITQRLLLVLSDQLVCNFCK